MTHRFLLPTLFVLSFTSVLASTTPRVEQRFRNDVEILSADPMEGRGLGTKGLERAAAYLEKRLKEIGVAPAYGRSYRQSFLVKTGVRLVEGNRLDGVANDDWIPLPFSSSGSFNGEAVFAGYGIHAPEIGYDDFEKVDLRGKVAVMLRYEPQESDDASPFSGRKPSRYSALRAKVFEAKKRGAVAVIFFTGPLQDTADRVPALKNDGPESDAGIPVLQVKRSVVQQWLGATSLESMQLETDRTLAPPSRRLGRSISGAIALEPTHVTAENIVGVIPGKGALAQEAIVIGAHYDHLGHGGAGSMRPNAKAIHNGADDNASGTAAVLSAAETLRSVLQAASDHRTVYVSLFAAEEVGLAGSAHFVSNPPLPVERIRAMVNLDMVGRVRDNKLSALGGDTAAEWKGIVQRAAMQTGLVVTAEGDGYGRSDHSSFYTVGIPVVHLFSGLHDAYHTPDDDASTINFEGGARVAEFTARVAADLAQAKRAPQYVKTSAAAPMQGDSRGYGAYLGSVPDASAMSGATGGVLLADVRPGSPASIAGIKGGDRIVAIDGTKIENLYDMTYALQSHRPGDTVTIGLLRGADRLDLKATLTERGATPAAPATHPVAPAPATAAAPAAPASPSQPAAAVKPSPFYDNRPGSSFIIKAGQPFATTFDGEARFAEMRQLTFGGENAEAYFSPDGKKLIYQATNAESKCDQQYVLNLESGATTRVSSGKGRTTCGYFDYPEEDRVVFASTESGGDDCPAPPDRSMGYVWPIYDSFELYEAKIDGSGLKRLTHSPGYDAEATWCHRGGKLVFTSMRDGDLDLYEMTEAGTVKRLTDLPGYDGGAFYNSECTEIVWRASRPEGEKLADYRGLLAKGLVRPSQMELFVMNADGSNQRQLTSNGAANFCPYFHPDGKRILFSSNMGSASGREFDIYMISKEGGLPERITTAEGFDGFPMFSPDGKFIVFASNRADPKGSSTNLFIAKWVE